MPVKDLLSNNPLARRALVVFLAAVFVVAVAAGIYIHIHYSNVMPHSPQAQTGRVYRMVVNHGTVVYVNKQELKGAHFVFYDLFTVGVVCFGLLVLLRIRFKKL
jgi:hypothetical protein